MFSHLKNNLQEFHSATKKYSFILYCALAAQPPQIAFYAYKESMAPCVLAILWMLGQIYVWLSLTGPVLEENKIAKKVALGILITLSLSFMVGAQVLFFRAGMRLDVIGAVFTVTAGVLAVTGYFVGLTTQTNYEQGE